MSSVEVVNLVKRWPGLTAVDRVSFTVASGSLTVLLGPSGCGKSTILRLIAGLEGADSGSILIDGIDKTGADSATRGISMVFQSYALFPHLSVRENILFGLKVRRVPKTERQSRLTRAARMVGLETLLGRKPSQLSGGQRQRVALARTIVSGQPVCLMDEPLSNLDAKLRAEMRDEIRRLQQELGLTLIYVTHDQTEAMTMADRVILIRNGSIEQAGAPEQLYTAPATTFAAQFIGQPPMNLLDGRLFEEWRETLPVQGEHWQLGVRPEDVLLTGEGPRFRVEGLDFLGAETLLRLRREKQQLTARVSGLCRLKPGDQVKVSWPPEAMHLFDEAGIRRAGPEPIPPGLA